MPRISILALIGLPAAGKTTFSQWLLIQHAFSVVHLCYDNFLHFSGSDHNPDSPFALRDYSNFKKQRNEILKTLEILIHCIQTQRPISEAILSKIEIMSLSGCNDFVVICDDNNYYRSMRYQLYQLCKSNHLSYRQIFFKCSLDIALVRNAKRTNKDKIPDHILADMSNKLEPPNNVANAWEKQTFTHEATQTTYYQILSFIKDSFDNIVESAAATTQRRQPQENSALHRLDIQLRRHISALLDSEKDPKTKQEKARVFNVRRKEMLLHLKQQNITVSDDDFTQFIDKL